MKRYYVRVEAKIEGEKYLIGVNEEFERKEEAVKFAKKLAKKLKENGAEEVRIEILEAISIVEWKERDGK